jgi:hypothetical protein
MKVLIPETCVVLQIIACSLPLLVPYLACGNDSIRSAIVHVLGCLVAHVYADTVSVLLHTQHHHCYLCSCLDLIIHL